MNFIPKDLAVGLAYPMVTEIELDLSGLVAQNNDISIPKKTYIEKVVQVCEVAPGGGATSPTLTVGDSVDVDRFLVAADIQEAAGGAIDSKTVTANAGENGYYYPDGGTFRIAVTAAGDRTSGKYRFLVYSYTSAAAN